MKIKIKYILIILTCMIFFVSCQKDEHVHVLIHHDEVAATCIADGQEEYYECRDCKKLFSDNEGKVEIDVVETIKALGHDLELVDEVAATCDAVGYKVHYECSRCHKLFTDNLGNTETTLVQLEIKKIDHIYGDYEIKLDPTENSTGTLVRYCENCNKEDVLILDELNEYTQEMYTKQTFHATCTEDGRVTFTLKIENFDGTSDWFTWTKTIEAPGHEFGKWVVDVKPTAAKDGTLIRECEQVIDNWNGPKYYCPIKETKSIPALQVANYPNNYEVIEVPTCLQLGLYRYTYIIDNQSFSFDVEVRGEHVYEKWLYDDSYHYHKCSVCGNVDDKFTHTLVNGICEVCGYEQTYTEGLLYGYNESNKTCSVSIGNAKDVKDIVIPATKDGYIVISVSNFRNNDVIESITLPNTIRTISKEAFKNCPNLKTLKIDNSSLTLIDDYAFQGTTIENLYITDLAKWCEICTYDTLLSGLEIYGYNYLSANPMYGCKNLYVNNQLVKDLVIPNGVTEIRPYAFYGLIGVDTLTIPDTVTLIDYRAFSIDTVKVIGTEYGLKKVVFVDSSNVDVAEEAFYYNTNLKSLNLGNKGPEIIWPESFAACAIEELIIPSEVKEIGEMAFAYSYAQTITIPNGIEIIGDQAFGASDMVILNIPASVIKIGSWAFQDSSLLTTVNIAENSLLETLGTEAFNNCKSLKTFNLPNSVLSIGERAFEDCVALEEFIILEDSQLKSIYTGAFMNTAISSFYIPAACDYLEYGEYKDPAATIPYYIFKDCPNLQEIIFADPTNWSYYNGNRYVAINEATLSNSTNAITYVTNWRYSLYKNKE